MPYIPRTRRQFGPMSQYSKRSTSENKMRRQPVTLIISDDPDAILCVNPEPATWLPCTMATADYIDEVGNEIDVKQAYLLSTTGRLLACPLLPPHLQPVQIASLRDLASALAHLSPDMCVFYLITPEDMSARIVLYGAWHTLISDIV